MKEKFQYKIVLLFILYLSIGNIGNTYCQTKTVEIDLATQDFVENKSKFPFDEPFSLKINNTVVGSTYVLNIIDISKRRKNENDSIILSSTFKATETSKKITCDKYLQPNHYFNIKIEARSERILTADEQKELKDKFLASPDFKEKIKNKFYHDAYATITIASFNKVIEYYLSQWGYTNYKIDYSKIEKDGDLQIFLNEATLRLATIGQNIKGLNDNIKRKNINGFNAKGLDNFIKTTKDGFIFPDLNNGTVENYIQLLEDEKTKVLVLIDQNDTTTIADLTSEFDDAIEGFKEDFAKFDQYIENWLDKNLDATVLSNIITLELLGSTVCNPNTDAGIYTSQTFGYGYSPGTDNGLFYFAFSFFSRAINNDVPFSNIRKKDRWRAMFCLNVGFTLEDISTNKNGRISGLGSAFNNKAGLIGLGFRPLPYLKIDVNAVLYHLDNPNPLINHKKFICSPLLGLSVNLNIVKILAGQPNSLTALKQQLSN